MLIPVRPSSRPKAGRLAFTLALAIALGSAASLPPLAGPKAQEQRPGALQDQDLEPQLRRLLAPLRPQGMTLRPVTTTLSGLLDQGWELVAASSSTAAEMYVLRRQGRHIRCLLLPTDLSAARPERLSLCAQLN